MKILFIILLVLTLLALLFFGGIFFFHLIRYAVCDTIDFLFYNLWGRPSAAIAPAEKVMAGNGTNTATALVTTPNTSANPPLYFPLAKEVMLSPASLLFYGDIHAYLRLLLNFRLKLS